MRLISLSHVNDPVTTSIYPGDPPFELEAVATIEKEGFYLQHVRQGEHTGTHWGAPGHFNPGEPLADELDPEDLYLPAVKIDVRKEGHVRNDVTVDDIKRWEEEHGRIPDESMVIIWTGWDGRWGTPAFHENQPGFAVETAQWLIETGRIGYRGGTGTDTFGPDSGGDTTYAVSKLIYRRHRISLECLANLAELPPTGAHILCGGQINKRGSGSPALVYGMIPPPG